MGWSSEKTRSKPPNVLSLWSYLGQPSFLKLQEVQHHVWNVVYQGSLPEIQCPEFLLGAGHVSNPSAWHMPEFPISWRKAGGQHKSQVHSLGTVSCSYQGMVGTHLKPKFPEASQGPALRTHASQNSSLRPAVLILFCTSPFERKAINWLKCHKLNIWWWVIILTYHHFLRQ